MMPDPDRPERPWMQAIPRFADNLQRIVVVLVLVLVLALLGVMIARLGWLLGVELLGTPIAQLSADQFLSLFSFMLLVLIGVELVEAVQLFLSDAHVHVEFLILIALTAICRKILILDPTKASPLTLVGIAALVVALAGAYFLIRGRLPDNGK
ncbi:MAG: phosphate-starvation-inducible PsiE family protein [Spirochaetaceae bacterium]|nr:phosphate-starvation-inducible PsiE family protein [Spirochaetaceae bacterium]